MSLNSQQLLQALPTLPVTPSEFLLALSGGLDSTVLLHLLAQTSQQLPAPVRALYIDHGLQADSSHWGEHCRVQCEALGVPFASVGVNAHPQPGESPEEAARRARYEALGEQLADDGVLLTAQHQDDQAETLLLQLLRGAGPRGMAAMPVVRRFASGWQWRPLLAVSRQQIREYAQAHELQWIEDPSNLDTRYARNFLRNEIMPLLRQHWPSAEANIARAASVCADMVTLGDDYLQQVLASLQVDEPACLPLQDLLELQPAIQRQLMLFWFRQQGVQAPTQAQLLRIEQDLLHSAQDAEPAVRWGTAQLRRYRNYLYLLPKDLPDTEDIGTLSWDGQTPLVLPVGELSSRETLGVGINTVTLAGQPLTVRFRQGGERIVLPGRQHSTSLKQAFQDAGVPPWQRNRLPLVFSGEQLVAVVGKWVSQPFAAQQGQPAIQFEIFPLH